MRRGRATLAALLTSLAAVVVVPAPAPARVVAATATDPATDPALAATSARKEALAPGRKKLAASLYEALQAPSSSSPAAARAADTALTNGTGLATGRALLDVTGAVDDALQARVRALGGTVVGAYPAFDALRIALPPAALDPLAEAPQVRHVEPAEQPLVDPVARAGARTAGTVTSEGVATHLVPLASASYGTTGKGVKVGVLSDGVDGSSGAGDLPGVTVLAGEAGAGSEGRAMLEIVHDMAPDAELFFATGAGGQASMANNILALAEAGCTIIVDDVTYLREPQFQDGVISRAVATVSAAGVTYFSSAGNRGRLSAGTASAWDGDWVDGNTELNGDTEVDFDPGPDVDTRIGYVPGANAYATLSWNDPIGASANDYDLYAEDAQGALWPVATDVQDGDDDPIESGLLSTFCPCSLVVVRRAGALPRHLRLVIGGTFTEYGTTGSIIGHNGAAAAVSVGATPASHRDVPPGPDGPYPSPFDATSAPEAFSSDGPVRLYYRADGTPITPGDLTASGGQVVSKPDLLAADDLSTSVPGFAPFLGTSAAAPSAAGIAALIRSARPRLAPAAVVAAMKAGSIDLAPAGWDVDTGAGIVMAPAALAAAGATAPADLVPLGPERLLDTRAALGQIGYHGAKPAAGQTIALQVTGAGTDPVPGDASAVALNVTGTGAEQAGFVTVFPCDAPRPLASNLNLAPDDTRANLVVTKLSPAGTVCLYTLGPADLVADVSGYVPANAHYTAIVPGRVLDTRPPAPIGYQGAPPRAGDTLTLAVADGRVVPTGASAVVMNVTAAEATRSGFVTVWPCDQPRPTASSLNLEPGVITPNLVVTKLSASGTVCLFTQSGGALIVDVGGYYTTGRNGYVPLDPERVLDTRIGLGASPEAVPGRTIELTVIGGEGHVPDDARVVALNVTGTDVEVPGFVTVWPCGTPRPNASNLNLVAGQTRPNLVLAKVGAGGKVCLFTMQPAALVADRVGWYP